MDFKKVRVFNFLVKVFERRGRWLVYYRELVRLYFWRLGLGVLGVENGVELVGWEEMVGGRFFGFFILFLLFLYRLMSFRMFLVLVSYVWGFFKIDRMFGVFYYGFSYCFYEFCGFRDYILIFFFYV